MRFLKCVCTWFTLSLLAGCEGSETQSVEIVPTLSISEIRTTTGVWSDLGDSSSVAIEVGCDAALAVSVAVQDFTFKAPGTCGSVPRCGYVELSLLRGETLVGKPVRGIGTSPVGLQASAPDEVSGSVDLQAQLVQDDGTTYLTAAGQSIDARLGLEISQPDCATAP